MENVISAAYIALLLGCLVRSDETARDAIKERLPGATFDPIIQMLSAFLQLHGSAGWLPPDRYLEVIDTIYHRVMYIVDYIYHRI